MEKVHVIESADIPEEIKDDLKNYYANSDHRGIPNDSYSRYPYIMDFCDEFEAKAYDWLKSQGVTEDDGYVIIHWDW